MDRELITNWEQILLEELQRIAGQDGSYEQIEYLRDNNPEFFEPSMRNDLKAKGLDYYGFINLSYDNNKSEYTAEEELYFKIFPSTLNDVQEYRKKAQRDVYDENDNLVDKKNFPKKVIWIWACYKIQFTCPCAPFYAEKACDFSS